MVKKGDRVFVKMIQEYGCVSNVRPDSLGRAIVSVKLDEDASPNNDLK